MEGWEEVRLISRAYACRGGPEFRVRTPQADMAQRITGPSQTIGFVKPSLARQTHSGSPEFQAGTSPRPILKMLGTFCKHSISRSVKFLES